MAHYDAVNGQWIDDSGGIHYTEQGARKADNSGGNWLGEAGGSILIFIVLLLPILTAKIIGFIFGLLTYLGVVGRILQTLIMAVLLLIVAALLGEMAREGDLLPDTVRFPLQAALVILPSVWYFLWHFNAMRNMGASEFSHQFKTLCSYLYFGVIGGYVWSMFGSMATGAVVAYIVTAIGVVVYLRGTKPYTRAAAIKGKAAKRVIMLIAIAATAVFGVFASAKMADYNAKEEAASEAEFRSQVPAGLPYKTPYEAILTANVKAIKIGADKKVTIPKGTQVTVSTYSHNSSGYSAYVNYKAGGSADFIIEDLRVIKPLK
jgi:hypothetical protein